MITIISKRFKVFNIISKYGFKNIFFSLETLLLIVSMIIVVTIAPKIGIENEIELIRSYVSICVGLSGGMLAVVLTAMSILVGMINDNFIKLIHKADAYYDFVTPFYLNAGSWSFGIVINISILTMTYIDKFNMNTYYNIVLISVGLSVGILVSSISGALELVFTSIKLGEYRAILLIKEEDSKED